MILDVYKEQTEHKHKYLRAYLATWFKILISHKTITNEKYNQIIYVDSFSNAGEYTKHEKGSPLIALEIFNNILKAEKNKKLDIEVKCYFNDYDKTRVEYLEELINKESFDRRIKIKYNAITANEHIVEVMKEIKKYSSKKALFFIDPYSVADDVVSLESLKLILENNDTEIIFNHMVSDVVRNIKNYPEKYETFYQLEKNTLNIPKKGKEFNDIFTNNLKKEINKAIYIASYEFLNTKNVTIYFLVFITHHPTGYEKMKEAIWKVSDGELYHKNTGNKNCENLSLFSNEDNTKLKQEKRAINIKNKVEDLKGILIQKFRGKEVNYEEIYEFVLKYTIFTKGHIQQKTLSPLEKEGKLIRIGTNISNSIYKFKE